jgi:hypothetical protein
MKFITEYWNDQCRVVPKDTPNAIKMKSCYTNDEVYIGDWKSGKYLESKGIEPINNHLGWCEKEQQWYGWSHRAIFGFGIGSTSKQGNLSFEPSHEVEFLQNLKNCYSDSFYLNLQFIPEETGVKITYDLKSYEPSCESINDAMDVAEFIQTSIPDAYVTVLQPYEQQHVNEFYSYPEKWGRGEWVAQTLEDAKEMAEAFAESVS